MSSPSPQTEPTSIAVHQVEKQLIQLSANIYAAEHRWLVLLASFDAQRGWARDCFRTCVGWLVAKVGMSRRLARDRLDVARALTRLPKISAAMANGSVSYSKVRALARMATAETEFKLLNLARQSTAGELERLARLHRRSTPAQTLDREEPQPPRRSLTCAVMEDGDYILRARLPAAAGALLFKALHAAVRQVDSSEGWSVRRADALCQLAQTYLAGEPKGMSVNAAANGAQCPLDLKLPATAPPAAERAQEPH